MASHNVEYKSCERILRFAYFCLLFAEMRIIM